MNKYILVGLTLETAQWLGMAPSVAGGCVAVSESGSDAAGLVGHDYIARIPTAWMADKDYTPLTEAQIDRISAYLDSRCRGWSGAGSINNDRARTKLMLFTARHRPG